MNGACYQS
jgi:alpha-glucosidase (family GH31 glycosyl hydrolase)